MRLMLCYLRGVCGGIREAMERVMDTANGVGISRDSLAKDALSTTEVAGKLGAVGFAKPELSFGGIGQVAQAGGCRWMQMSGLLRRARERLLARTARRGRGRMRVRPRLWRCLCG